MRPDNQLQRTTLSPQFFASRWKDLWQNIFSHQPPFSVAADNLIDEKNILYKA